MNRLTSVAGRFVHLPRNDSPRSADSAVSPRASSFGVWCGEAGGANQQLKLMHLLLNICDAQDAGAVSSSSSPRTPRSLDSAQQAPASIPMLSDDRRTALNVLRDWLNRIGETVFDEHKLTHDDQKFLSDLPGNFQSPNLQKKVLDQSVDLVAATLPAITEETVLADYCTQFIDAFKRAERDDFVTDLRQLLTQAADKKHPRHDQTRAILSHLDNWLSNDKTKDSSKRVAVRAFRQQLIAYLAADAKTVVSLESHDQNELLKNVRSTSTASAQAIMNSLAEQLLSMMSDPASDKDRVSKLLQSSPEFALALARRDPALLYGFIKILKPEQQAALLSMKDMGEALSAEREKDSAYFRQLAIDCMIVEAKSSGYDTIGRGDSPATKLWGIYQKANHEQPFLESLQAVDPHVLEQGRSNGAHFLSMLCRSTMPAALVADLKAIFDGVRANPVDSEAQKALKISNLIVLILATRLIGPLVATNLGKDDGTYALKTFHGALTEGDKAPDLNPFLNMLVDQDGREKLREGAVQNIENLKRQSTTQCDECRTWFAQQIGEPDTLLSPRRRQPLQAAVVAQRGVAEIDLGAQLTAARLGGSTGGMPGG